MISVPVLGRALVKLFSSSSPAETRRAPTFLGHPAEVGQRWSDEEAETAYRFSNLPNTQKSWLTLLRRFLRPWGPSREMRITAQELRGVTQPTLLIWGKNDPFGSPDAGNTVAALMPHAELLVVGIGHLPWWDELDECVRLVRAFVSRMERH
jgi:pimeloyl-ACP methyl ester carboxylesterase